MVSLEFDGDIKMLRETLSAAQSALRTSAPKSVERLQQLIDECERHRPTGPDGKHGDRHTPTCGCDDVVIRQFTGKWAPLSNFWVEKNGKTVEHRFQVAKTRDQYERNEIWESPTPGIAKRRGREATLREDWEEDKIGVMYHLVREKFEEDEELEALLLSTGDWELQEGNNWGDKFWGVGLGDETGQGENWLGKILMAVRSELRGDGIPEEFYVHRFGEKLYGDGEHVAGCNGNIKTQWSGVSCDCQARWYVAG